jgi:HSP90 family molecular chaperone
LETIAIVADATRALAVLKEHVFADPAICVRELIANAADSRPSQITLRVDPTPRLLEVADDGAGMTRTEVASLLGTMFATTKTDGQEAVGRFGIGFYSCFSLCSEVDVLTRTCDPGDTGTHVRYRGGQRLEILDDPVQRVGTAVRLTLLPEHVELLDEGRLGRLVRRPCDFLQLPILVGPELVNAADAPWYRAAAEDDLRRGLVELLGLDQPLAAFSVDAQLGSRRVRGVLHFAPRGRHPATVRLYSNRVLVSESDATLVDEHLRGALSAVLDVDDLPLTISRDAALETSSCVRELRPMLVERLAAALADLASRQPTRFRRVMADHGAELKAACLHHRVLLSSVRDHLPYRSSLRPYVTVPEYLASRDDRVVVYADDLSLAAAFLPLYERANVEVLFMTDRSDVSLREGWDDHTFLRLDVHPIGSARPAAAPGPSAVTEEARELLQELFRSTVGLVTIEARALDPDGPPALVLLSDHERRQWRIAEHVKTKLEQGRHSDLPRELRGEEVSRQLARPISQSILLNTSHPIVRRLAGLLARGALTDREHRIGVMAARFLYALALMASGLPVSPAKARELSRDLSALATCLLDEAVGGEEHDAPLIQH